MPRILIRVDTEKGEQFLEWSTVVDAPVTYGMTEEQLREYIKEEYGNRGLLDLDARIERCRDRGTSSYVTTSLEEVLVCNRAGPKETKLSLQEIIERYCNIEKEDG